MMIRGGASADKSVNAEEVASELEKINAKRAWLKSRNGTNHMEYTYVFLMRSSPFS